MADPTITPIAYTALSTAQTVAANDVRSGVIIYNGTNAAVYVALGGTASVTRYSYQLLAGSTLELPQVPTLGRGGGVYKGALSIIQAAAPTSGYVMVTEVY